MLIKNCPSYKDCDCGSCPAECCDLKKTIEYCIRQKESNPRSDTRALLQLGKILIIDEVLQMMNVQNN